MPCGDLTTIVRSDVTAAANDSNASARRAVNTLPLSLSPRAINAYPRSSKTPREDTSTEVKLSPANDLIGKRMSCVTFTHSECRSFVNFSFTRLMRSVSVVALLLGSGMSWYGRAAIAALPASSVTPPNPTVVAQLPDGAYMHFLQLPLGDMDGALVGNATFEPSGRRAAFMATFPGATLGGDWRSLDP